MPYLQRSRDSMKAQIEIDGKRYGRIGPYKNRVMVAMSLRQEGFEPKVVLL